MIGADVRAMDEDSRSVWLNAAIIKVNQDPLGKQGVRVRGNATAPQGELLPLALQPCCSALAAPRLLLLLPLLLLPVLTAASLSLNSLEASAR